MVWIAVGQVFVAADIVSSYLPEPRVHVVAVLLSVILVMVLRLLGIAAADRERADEVLRLRESRFRTLVQQSSDVITVVDAGGIVTYVLPSVERVTGITADEMQGTLGLSWVHDDGVEAAEAAFVHVTRCSAEESIDSEIRVRHGDGSWHWHEISVRNLLDDPAVAGIVANHRDITERRQWQDHLTFDATHDPLSGLPNRALFLSRLAEAILRIPDDQGVAVLFIDLDRFKDVNDAFGHDVGDQLLSQAAMRLARVLRPEDTVARLGGDEFTVLMEGIRDVAPVLAAVDRMQAAITAPYSIGGGEAIVGASVGVAFVWDATEDPDSVLRDADMAMYRAKKHATGYEVFDPSIRDEFLMRRETERELRSALANGELEVYYQPLIDLDTRSIAGAEALVRWNHPTRGLLGPAEFVPLAESIGLIAPIGD